MAGKLGVFLCHTEKIYSGTPWEEAVRAWLSRGRTGEHSPPTLSDTLSPVQDGGNCRRGSWNASLLFDKQAILSSFRFYPRFMQA